MSELLERWKRQTVLMVKNTGAVSAATALEMMEYIAQLEQKLSHLTTLINDNRRAEKVAEDVNMSDGDLMIPRMEGINDYRAMLKEATTISDGFGSTWSKTCPMCGKETMEIVRPGKVQCANCG